MNKDPIRLLGGINEFGYVYQNPLIHTDPKGLSGILDPILIPLTKPSYEGNKPEQVPWEPVTICTIVGGFCSTTTQPNNIYDGFPEWLPTPKNPCEAKCYALTITCFLTVGNADAMLPFVDIACSIYFYQICVQLTCSCYNHPILEKKHF